MKKDEKAQSDPRIQSIGKRIQELRKAKGYTSYESFAFENDLPRVQYWKMEKGINCRISSLFEILDIHEITLEEFFNGIER